MNSLTAKTYQINTSVYVESSNVWQKATIVDVHRITNSEHRIEFYDVVYEHSNMKEFNIESYRIFPVTLFLKDIIKDNMINLVSDEGSVVEKKNIVSNKNIQLRKNINEFRATTPTQPRYAEMFLTMQQDLNTLRQQVNAVIAGPVQRQENDMTKNFDWRDFDSISTFSPPVSIQGDLQSIVSNNSEKNQFDSTKKRKLADI